MSAHPTIKIDPEAQRKIDILTDKAFEILLKNLGSYGSKPNRAHQDALREILHLFSRIAFGAESGRHAVPLATGAGKTQSIVAFITAVHQLGYDEISLAVCASQVEALCELKRSLYFNEVPDEITGLWHSYEYDEEKAIRYMERGRQGLEQGYATLPSTENHTAKQFLLVTHNRLRGKGSVKQYGTYKGKPRSILVWDETLFLSDCYAIELEDLEGATDWLQRKQDVKHVSLLKYLRESLVILQEEAKRQDDEKNPKLCTMPSIDEDPESFKWLLPRDTTGEIISIFLEMSMYPLRVYHGQKKSLITYNPVIDQDLSDIVVLDASNSIRKLCALNKRIKRHPVRNRDLVSYQNVTINQLCFPSGRNKVERYTAELNKSDEGVLKEVVQVIKDTPENEAILVFTFKQQYRGQDHVGALKRSLRKNGVKVDEKITVKEWFWERDERVLRDVKRPRINFMTWGSECGWNHLSYCTTVVLAGVLHRREDDLASYVISELDDPSSNLEVKEIRDIRTSEVCHCIYQALSRGSCRVIKNGKAGGMTVWLVHKNKDIRETINEVMPGVKWAEWKPVHVKPETKPDEIAEVILGYLKSLSPDEKQVSTRRLKRDISRLKDVKSTTLTRSVRRAAEVSHEWVYMSGSLVRDLFS